MRFGFTTITMVDACDMPENVIDWCTNQEIQTHYQNDVVCLEDDGNPFAEWIKKEGYKFKEEYDYIAINAT